MANEIIANANAQFTLIADQVIAENRPAMAGLPTCRVKSIAADVPSVSEKFALLPTSPAVAGSISDGTAMSNTALVPTSVTLTAAPVGLGGVVTDLSAEGTLINDAVALGYFGRGCMEKFDTDVTATFVNFTTNSTVGTSGTAMSLANFQSAQYELEVARVPGRYVSLFHTIQLLYLRNAIVSAAAGIWANPNQQQVEGIFNDIGNTALKGELLGTPVYQSMTCVSANSGVDRVGAMYQVGDDDKSLGAIGFLWKWMLRFETLRQPLYPGAQVAATGCYGTALLVPLYGVKIVNLGS